MSEQEIQFERVELKNSKGETYHVVLPEKCRIKIVTRHNGNTEAAFIRSNGAWLPPVFKS